jgi:hypothetical protein
MAATTPALGSINSKAAKEDVEDAVIDLRMSVYLEAEG